jgi:holo-[acyl-carrier protein] synthase
MARSKKTQQLVDSVLATPVPTEQVGLGVDIVEIERVRAILKRSPAFAKRGFSADEQAYCNKTVDPAIHYATRFAAKEAVVKALGTGFTRGINMRDIEVCRAKNGRPTVKLSGAAAEVAREAGVVQVPLSLSYTHTEAVACAMAITAPAESAAQKRQDPLDEMTQQFKELRKML